jgi:RNA polymerase sigma-54 factor
MLQVQTFRPSQTLRPLTTAHLAQTMSLLELTAAELNQKIETELSQNPALEVGEERRCPTCHRPLIGSQPCPRCSTPKSLSMEEPIIFVSPRQDFYVSRRSSGEDLPEDNLTPVKEDLPTYVLRQIAPDLEPDERRLAAHLLTNLDEDGLLTTTPMEVARYHHVTPGKVEKILEIIQRADPIGVGCSSPKQALLVQLESLAENCPVPAMADEAIRQGLELLSRRQYSELGRLLGISSRKVREIARFISDNLNPYPGRAYWGDIRQGNAESPSVYTHPDVIISLLQGIEDAPLVVEIVSPYLGLLKVNPLFRQALGQAPADKVDQWKSDLERADLLVKCIQQRTNTMVRLMRRITKLQREFILHGDPCLRPYTRARLAEELEVHESTISRAVSNKAAQLPNGHIIPLAKFFDRSLHIRSVIKEIINDEIKPLSDHEIANLLTKRGFEVARRTVAKYRSMEGILPSHLRQAKEPPITA